MHISSQMLPILRQRFDSCWLISVVGPIVQVYFGSILLCVPNCSVKFCNNLVKEEIVFCFNLFQLLSFVL